MEREEILESMREFFGRIRPPEQLEEFESLRPGEILGNSMEAMDLIFHLEELTGQEMGLAEIGPAVASMNFSDLAGEVHRLTLVARA